MNYQYIQTDEQLQNGCLSLNQSATLAMDTEFVRVTSFYPHLGLLQVHGNDACFLIDPLLIQDWAPFKALLNTKQIVLHACGEDVEVFNVFFNCVPSDPFDTQIGALFLGAQNYVSYADLVQDYHQITLDKTAMRTDWLARPLSQTQCQYAANDVIYLSEIATQMQAALQEKGWLAAAKEESHDFAAYRSEIKTAQTAYLSIKKYNQVSSAQWPYVKALATWRFETAQREDSALNFVLQEETLLNLAKYKPRSFGDYARFGVYGKKIKSYGSAIKLILDQTFAPEAKPELLEKTSEYRHLAHKLKERALDVQQETGLSPLLLVQKRHVLDYVRWQRGESALLPVFLSGWRAPYFENF